MNSDFGKSRQAVLLKSLPVTEFFGDLTRIKTPWSMLDDPRSAMRLLDGKFYRQVKPRGFGKSDRLFRRERKITAGQVGGLQILKEIRRAKKQDRAGRTAEG
jgi:hypothetical protein